MGNVSRSDAQICFGCFSLLLIELHSALIWKKLSNVSRFDLRAQLVGHLRWLNINRAWFSLQPQTIITMVSFLIELKWRELTPLCLHFNRTQTWQLSLLQCWVGCVHHQLSKWICLPWPSLRKNLNLSCYSGGFSVNKMLFPLCACLYFWSLKRENNAFCSLRVNKQTFLGLSLLLGFETSLGRES